MLASRILSRSRLSLLLVALSLPAPAFAYDGLDDVQGSIGFDLPLTTRTDLGKACVAQTDGKVVIAGTITSNDGEGHQIALARIGLDGLLDPTFGNGGRVVIDLSVHSIAATEGDALAVAVDVNQNIVVAGTARSEFGQHDPYGIAFRLLPDGSRDFDWAVGGAWEYGGVGRFTAIGFDRSGRLWLVGPEKADNTGGWGLTASSTRTAGTTAAASSTATTPRRSRRRSPSTPRGMRSSAASGFPRRLRTPTCWSAASRTAT
jgi:hypothetical protein